MSEQTVATRTWQQRIGQLPVQHEFQISAEGEIFSRQCLTLPATWLPASFTVQRAHLQALGPLYFRRLPRLTRGLISVEQSTTPICFRLLIGGPVLLRFDAPAVQQAAHGGSACYPIVGGLAAVGSPPRQGALCLTLHGHAEGVTVCMEVRNFYAWLMGSGRIWRARRLLYTWTQAALHHLIAKDFVRQVALALCTGRLAEA